ncbi:hypothetical protein EHS39_31125 [Ensifer sp. MPMI2T]|nr:hypothetical protein EHS39_31125 [Ensifer sp. MPMI2T]
MVAFETWPIPRERLGEGHGASVTADEVLTGLSCGEKPKVIIVSDAWGKITPEVVSALALCALQQPERLVAVCPASPALVSGREKGEAQSLSGEILVISEADRSLLSSKGSRPILGEELEAIMSADAPPSALIIQGHGTEHCIQLADTVWFSMDPSLAPPGQVISPSSCRIPIVIFLSCAPLRMGGSMIPQRFSVAGALFDAGATVIGACHNVFAVFSLIDVALHGLMEGNPCGAIANKFNERMLARTGLTPFVTLGDPQRRATIEVAGTLPQRDAFISHSNAAACVATAKRLTWLVELSHTLQRCTPLSDELREVLDIALDTARLLLVASKPDATTRLHADEYLMLLQRGTSVASHLSQSIFSEIFSFIRLGRWLDSLFLPVSETTVSRSGPLAPDCIDIAYDLFGTGAMSLIRRESLSAGTMRDHIGNAPASRPKFVQTAAGIEVRLPPLDEHVLGAGLFHRSARHPRFDWPPQGAFLEIPYKDLPYRGRLTLAFARLGADFLCMDYFSFFVES